MEVRLYKVVNEDNELKVVYGTEIPAKSQVVDWFFGEDDVMNIVFAVKE